MNEIYAIIAEKLGLALSYVEQNAPDVIARYIKYLKITDVIGICVCLIIIFTAIIFAICAFLSAKKCRENKKDTVLFEWFCESLEPKNLTIVIIAVLGMVSIFALIVFAIDISNLIKLNVCPEMVLIELLK